MTSTPQPPAGQQGGGQSQGGPSAQSATAGGDVRQMRVDDLINLANQQNLDVSALNDLLGQIQVSPDINVQGTGSTGGGDAGQQGGGPTPGGPQPAQG
jgi:hypothetical protein